MQWKASRAKSSNTIAALFVQYKAPEIQVMHRCMFKCIKQVRLCICLCCSGTGLSLRHLLTEMLAEWFGVHMPH